MHQFCVEEVKKYQESEPIEDARVAVVLRTGNTGFPNASPRLFIGKGVGLCYMYIIGKDVGCGTMFRSSSLSSTLQVVEKNRKDFPICEGKDQGWARYF